MKNSKTKNAPQQALQNVSKLDTYQIKLHVYSIPKRSWLQKLFGGLIHGKDRE